MNQRQDQHKLLIFNAQVHQAILKIVEIFLPLEISARDLDDKMLWEILCHASVEQGYIESSCRVLDDAPSGNTVRAHLIEALGTEQHRERRVSAVGRVHVDEPGRELPLRRLEALPGDPEVVRVGGEVVLDVRQLHVREVVSLDRTLQARIELLDLRHHALRLRSLRGDRVCGSGPRSGRRERGCECDD